METLTHTVTCTNQLANYCAEYEISQQFVGVYGVQLSYIFGIATFFLSVFLITYLFRNQ